jgi:hypothetical protein
MALGRFFQALQVEMVILVVGEDRFAIVTASNDVLGLAVYKVPWQACHGYTLFRSGRQIITQSII